MPRLGTVFVSYAPQDAPLCNQIFAALAAWEIPYRVDIDRSNQLSANAQQAIVESTAFIRVCTPATAQSLAVNLQTTAFRGLQAGDRQRGRGEQRTLINLVLAPGYIREPLDNATLFIDATSLPRAQWLGDLGRALGVARQRGRLSRRSLLGLTAASITTLASLGAAGAFLLDYRTQIKQIQGTPGLLRWHVSASAKLTAFPFFGDNAVYAVSETGAYAFDLADGHTLWHNQLTPPKSILLSPVLAGDLLIFAYDYTLFALDIHSGKQRWTGQIKVKEGAWISAASFPANGHIYVLSVDGYLSDWTLADGKEQWSVLTTNKNNGDFDSGPMVDGNLIVMGSVDHNVYAFNTSDGSVKWQYTTNGSVVSTPAIANGLVYVAALDGYVYALNAHDGTLRWKFHIGHDINAPVTVAGGVVFVGADDYFLYALDGATGALYWRSPAGSLQSDGFVQDGKFIRTQPAVEGNVVAVAAEDTLFAFNVRDGALRWSWKPQSKVDFQVLTPCVIQNGLVSVGARDQQLYVFNA